jgi:cytoskeletal protein CcmA (bactofilin family)
MVLLLPTFGFAAELRTAEVVTKEESPKNLYLAGENPTVDADTQGDLVIAGGLVTVNGSVEHNVLAAGGTLNLNGNVGGNVRVAGGTVNIESKIDGDLVVFGGDVILGTKSTVAGDLLVFGGTVTLKGEVAGSIKQAFAGYVLIGGKVGGDAAFARVDTLKLDSTANIGGNLFYSSKKEAIVASSAKVGGKVEYTKLTAANVNHRDFGASFGSVFIGMVMAFVTIIVFVKLLPKFALNTIQEILVDPWKKIGIGFLAIVVTPIVMFLLLFTFVGWGILGYLTLVYILFFALTGTLSALLVGSYVWKFISKEKDMVINWKTVAVGVVLVALIKLILVVGWLVSLVLASLVFGTLVLKGYNYIKSQQV